MSQSQASRDSVSVGLWYNKTTLQFQTSWGWYKKIFSCSCIVWVELTAEGCIRRGFIYIISIVLFLLGIRLLVKFHPWTLKVKRSEIYKLKLKL